MNFMTSFYNNLSGYGKGHNNFDRITAFIKKQLILVPLAALIFVASCEEDATKIGRGILPASDFENIVTTDTFTLQLFSRYTDTTKSVDPSVSFLGKLQDPFFGLTATDFVTQLWLYESWPELGLLHVDSLKLTIGISEIIGNMAGTNHVNIYEIDEFLHKDSVYYVNRNVPIKQLLGSFEIPVFTEGDTVLTVHLPVEFGEELLRDTTRLFLSNDTADFRNYFNGLYFEYVQTDDNHMLGVDLIGGNTTLSLYYSDGDTISRSYLFLTNSKCVRYNRYLRDFETADPEKKIKYINQPFLDTLAYVQSFDGVYTKIVMPGLEGLKDQMPIAINKARIYLPVYLEENVYTEEMIPGQILARYVDSTGVKRYLDDYNLSASFLDGEYDYINNRYSLNIVNFVQKYLDGNIPEPAIELFLPGFSGINLIMRANGASLSPVMEVAFTELY